MYKIRLEYYEIKTLLKLSAPSGYRRLYKNLDELEDITKDLNKYLEKSNYSKVTDIYTRKKIIKEDIIKSQLTLLRIYQQAILAKKQKNNEYIFEIQEPLIALFVENLTFRILKINSLVKKGKADKDYQLELTSINSILKKVHMSVSAQELYKADKISSSNLDILKFSMLDKSQEEK